MKSTRSILYLVLIVAGLLLIKFLFFPGNKDEELPKTGNTKGNATPPSNVTGFIVKPSPVNNKLYVSGNVLANESVELRPEIAGKVISISFKEGESVKSGQLLLKIEDADLLAQLRKVQAQLKLAYDKMNRMQEIFNVQGVSREEFDAAENAYKSLQADEEILKVQIGRTEIRAPFDGVVGLRNVSKGSFIMQDQVVAGIQQLDPVKIDFSVPERYANLIQKNIKIDFSIEGNDDHFSGTVYAIDPQINTSTRSLMVRAKADNPRNKITPGAFARVEILLDKIENALMIPTQAIVPVLKGQQVYVSKDGKAVSTPVEIGVRQDKFVQVTKGIQAGDTIVTTGVMGLRPGASLRFLAVE